jgi:predicted O-linked N-acetylglucosamine transferase (SPINDLY family)
MTIPELLALGLQYHQAGDFGSAEQVYRQILEVEPNSVDAIHLLGVIALQTGKYEDAAKQIERAVALKTERAELHNNLGAALQRQDRLDQAAACYRQALQLNPTYTDAHHNLGNLCRAQGKLDEAVSCYQRALQIQPHHAQAYNGLGIALFQQAKFDEAIACFRRASLLNPDFADPYYNLGNAWKERQNLDEAVACYRQALRLQPESAEIHNNLGNTLHAQGKLEDAAVCFRRALESQPSFALAHNNLGNTLKDQGKLDEAVACFRRALDTTPDDPELHNNLGNALKDQGKLDEAVTSLRRALELKPDFTAAHSNLVCTLHYSPNSSSQGIREELDRWAGQHADSLARDVGPYANDRSPRRRLRLGYVSPDFRDHVVGRNVWPLVRNHDHEQFEITLYANLTCADAMSDQFRNCADHWRSIGSSTDGEAADHIRLDQIDILVDLAVHTAGNRLLVFARKPAPVQVSFAGYPGSTGLAAIDYRLTDPYLDPPGERGWYVEEPYRLPHTFWCYVPPAEAPATAPLPARKAGVVTFGCLNNFCKVNDRVLDLWAKVLRAVKGSRLLLLAKDGSHCARTVDFLASRGIAAERVTFCPPKPRGDYLATYHQIDIGLDTFPYNGHTTSLDSFWMGVPVITLVGDMPVGRAGLSQLSNLGLDELAARRPEDFVRIATEWAGDLSGLDNLRTNLRERMMRSPLGDAPGFAGDIEAAYLEIWRRWCEG